MASSLFSSWARWPAVKRHSILSRRLQTKPGEPIFGPVHDSAAPKKTPLYDEHVRRGARIVEFGGWSMPVQYSGIIDEHHTVRKAVGLFDISHMGQFIVSGPNAKTWLDSILTNNVCHLDAGECQYTFLLNERGGVIDDLIVYQVAAGKFLLVVNAAKIDEDWDWMQQHFAEGVELENRSETFAGLAIQGPKSTALFDLFFEGLYSRPAHNEIKEVRCGAMQFYISSTGYTGEDGFEIFFPAENAAETWNKILDKGAEFGIKPCGLGARDTLRLEMCYPLNGSDLAPDRTPLEAGLAFFVDLQKGNFIGRDALLAQRERGVRERLVPFKMKEKSPPPRPHYPLFKDGQRIGEIASGAVSPTLNAGIGMAYIPTEFARINERIEVEIRGQRFPATIEKKPLHRKSG